MLNMSAADGGNESFIGTYDASSSNNVSSDGTAPGSVTGQTAYASYFLNITNGSENLHLVDTTEALFNTVGADLDQDANLPVTEDFDQHTRHATPPDIGADEFRSIGPYSYFKNVTIDRTKIDDPSCGTTLTNFPMLYNSVDTNLRDHVTDPQGDDIIFTAVDATTCGDAGLAPCVLDHEVESWNAVTGHLVAWVRLPSVNTNVAGLNTVIQIVYGNTDITSSTQTQKPADVMVPEKLPGGVAFERRPVGRGASDRGQHRHRQQRHDERRHDHHRPSGQSGRR